MCSIPCLGTEHYLRDAVFLRRNAARHPGSWAGDLHYVRRRPLVDLPCIQEHPDHHDGRQAGPVCESDTTFCCLSTSLYHNLRLRVRVPPLPCVCDELLVVCVCWVSVFRAPSPLVSQRMHVAGRTT